MLAAAQAQMHVAADYQPILREIGLDADAVFTHPDIRVWRSIPERENCTLDAALVDGRRIRLHIKRHHPTRHIPTPADEEACGIQLLLAEQIPTAPLVAWGTSCDGRCFLITEDLAGYRPLDKLLEAGLPFDHVRDAVADLAARLHRGGLHHRDLYLCHFFARTDQGEPDLRLIDAARVRRLPNWPFRQRWIIKDLAQLWYSTTRLPITDAQRQAMLARYAQKRGLPSPHPLRHAIERKARWIARHDAKLQRKQPGRGVSIPAP